MTLNKLFNTILGIQMKNTMKLLMTSIALVSVLAGCQSLATQPTAEPNITGTDVI